MSITFKEVMPPLARDEEAVGKLEYGTVLVYNSSKYIKINKRKLGEGLRYTAEDGRKVSVLCNLKLGTLRIVSADTIVRVLNVEALVSPGEAVTMTKDWYKDKNN